MQILYPKGDSCHTTEGKEFPLIRLFQAWNPPALDSSCPFMIFDASNYIPPISKVGRVKKNSKTLQGKLHLEKKKIFFSLYPFKVSLLKLGYLLLNYYRAIHKTSCLATELLQRRANVPDFYRGVCLPTPPPQKLVYRKKIRVGEIGENTAGFTKNQVLAHNEKGRRRKVLTCEKQMQFLKRTPASESTKFLFLR